MGFQQQWRINCLPNRNSALRLDAKISMDYTFVDQARYDGRIVGAILCGHDGRRGLFYHTGVLPEYQRNGIAQRMVERSLSCLREEGITAAFCFTHEENSIAQAFWRGTGWEYCSWVQYHHREFGTER